MGSGGREHALAWRLSRDSDVSAIFSAPGNPGISGIGPCLPADLAVPADLVAIARRERIDLTVVGPEAPLERGLADLFREHGLAIVGPGRRGAALECSKSWAKAFMLRHGIPTARFADCQTLSKALDVLGRGDLGGRLAAATATAATTTTAFPPRTGSFLLGRFSTSFVSGFRVALTR